VKALEQLDAVQTRQLTCPARSSELHVPESLHAGTGQVERLFRCRVPLERQQA
jgi:hypothetical protein